MAESVNTTPGDVNKISNRLEELTGAVNKASKSSAKLAFALNMLTGVGTAIALVALFVPD